MNLAGTGGADEVQGANADCQSEDYPAADGDGDAGGKPIREGGYCGLVLCTQYTISSSNKKEILLRKFAVSGQEANLGGRRRCAVSSQATSGFTPRSPHLAPLTSTSTSDTSPLHRSEGRSTGPCDAFEASATWPWRWFPRLRRLWTDRARCRSAISWPRPRGSEGRLPLRLLCDSGRFDGCRLLWSPLDGADGVVIRMGWARGS